MKINARPVITLVAVLTLGGCAGLKPNDPWRERSAQQNERVAETWRRAGEPALGERFATQAERDRAAMHRDGYGFVEAVLDTLLMAWLDQPLQTRSKR
jgi:hypothetical protein